jgi:hypothetical protein
VDGNGVETGENGQAEVWLLTPQAYPQAFWIGRRVEVAEGTRIVGQIEVLQILNPTLKLSDSANESPPALARQMEILAEKFMLERLIFWRDAQGSLRPLVQ